MYVCVGDVIWHKSATNKYNSNACCRQTKVRCMMYTTLTPCVRCCFKLDLDELHH